MRKTEQHHTKHPIRRAAIITTVVLIVVLCGTGILFIDELKIINSIRKIDAEKPIYSMEIKGDYHFAEFIKAGGASSDRQVSAFLTKMMSKGFYSVDVENTGPACSVISAKAPDGAQLWGRNFDWSGSVPIVVRCTPQDGYASISTCDFQNITADANAVPEGVANKMLAIAALYVPMDGMNEAGLCVADLEVNEGGMAAVDTAKPDLTVTTAIRLLLNQAATVDEAVDLLGQYDIHASGGISHHIALADATGASIVVEFVKGELIAVETNFVTNFNLANGNPAAGGESARQRYETLSAVYQANKGIMTSEQVKDALLQTAQFSGRSTTQWSIVYDQASLGASYYFYGDYESPYSYSILN